ncbi:MAG: hypothetical protein LBQ43_02420 [Holosporales bacterium]|nr:hypothetical protein [Holosporales bacterium]
MEKLVITGISSKHSIVKVDIIAIHYISVLCYISERNIPFDILRLYESDVCDKIPDSKLTHIILIIEAAYAEVMEACCSELVLKQRVDRVIFDRDVAEISVVGLGLENSTILSVLKTCSDNNVSVSSLSTSRLRISFITAKQNVEVAIFALHSVLFPAVDSSCGGANVKSSCGGTAIESPCEGAAVEFPCEGEHAQEVVRPNASPSIEVCK